MYHVMTKKVLIESIMLIQEFSEKFPMLTIRQINYQELAKFYQKDPKDLLATVVFLDCMRKTNESSKKNISYFVDINTVYKIKIRRKEEQWIFNVYRNAQEKIKLTHQFSF